MKIHKEFKEFFYEYRVLGLAVAFIMGAATNELVQSLVNNIIMPFIDPLIKDGTWQTATLSIGPITLGWGQFLSTFLHFFIIALVVFAIVKLFRKKTGKKK